MSKPPHLPDGFEVLVDEISEGQYNEACCGFRDATIYQTWAYSHARSARASTIVLREKGAIRALAQVRITKPPLVPVGIGYLHWGPLWQAAEVGKDYQILSTMLRAIRNEYVRRRRLFLLVRPNLYDIHADAGRIFSHFLKEGYFFLGSDIQVALLDLTKSMEGLRQGLRPPWRRHLRAAERVQLRVTDGHDLDTLRRFRVIYEEMASRKCMRRMDVNTFEEVYRSLPLSLRPQIRLCWHDGDVVAAGVFSITGKKAIYLHGATSNAAIERRLNAGHFLHWSFVEWLSERGFEEYDLAGANPDRNGGTYQFKAGLCGTKWRNGCMANMWLFGSCAGGLKRSAISALLKRRVGVQGP